MKIHEAHTEAPDFVPLCPHCEAELHWVFRISDQGRGFFESNKGYAYACPHCRKLLGFADWAMQ